METNKQTNENINKINFTKGRIKELYNILTQANTMITAQSEAIKQLLEYIEELYDLSHRRNMEDYIYIFSRRQKAIRALAVLDVIKDEVTEEQYQTAKNLLKNIFLENRSKQILPEKHGIIKSGKLKTELYLNMNTEVNHTVLEPREYIGIDPEAGFDSDAPSIVTAMTPPHYEQPIHNHENNREITFYTGPSIGKFYDEGQEHIIEANFGDFIIFPPKTYHTIQNPNEFPVRNISIKLPGALFDRGKTLDETISGKGEKQALDCVDKGIYKKTFEIQQVPYHIHIYDFTERESFTIQPEGKSALYVLGGEFICQIDEDKKHAMSESDVIIANDSNTITISTINPGMGKIYMVTLHAIEN